MRSSYCILTMATASYRYQIDIWLPLLRRHHPDIPVIIGALDTTTQEWLQQHHGDDSALTVLTQGSEAETQTRTGVMAQRMNILCHDLLGTGYSVIVSDLDSFALQPFLDRIDHFPGDILYQPASGKPKAAIAQWGFNLCCGFAVYRQSPATLAFARDVAARTLKAGSDQIVTNMLLLETAQEQNQRWQGGINSEQYLQITHADHELTITALPVRQFYRGQILSREVLQDCLIWQPKLTDLGYEHYPRELTGIVYDHLVTTQTIDPLDLQQRVEQAAQQNNDQRLKGFSWCIAVYRAMRAGEKKQALYAQQQMRACDPSAPELISFFGKFSSNPLSGLMRRLFRALLPAEFRRRLKYRILGQG